MLNNKLLLAFIITLLLIIGRNSQELRAVASNTAPMVNADEVMYQTQPPCNPKTDKNCQ